MGIGHDRSGTRVIGGSGVYDLPVLEDVREERIASPWASPRNALRIGRIGATKVVFLARHGRGHRFSPSGINYRANIDTIKRAGVTDIVSLSACGSFRDELHPGTFVLVDQFVDRTHGRASSFFGDGCVAHVSLAHPVGPNLQKCIAQAAKAEEIAIHRGGTYVCMEGAAILVARRIPRLQGAGLRRDRHDQHARGQARGGGPRSPTRPSRW